MKTQKTFPKGTDYNDLFDFLDDAIIGYCEVCATPGPNELTKDITLTITIEEK